MKISFITQFLPSPDAERQAGGTISNLNFLRFVSQEHEVTVLSFDRTADEACFADEDFKVVHRPHPDWGGYDLLLHWNAFVRDRTREFLDVAGPHDLTLAATSGLPSFDALPRGAARAVIVQAYEHFGFRCPWVPVRTRVNLAKQAMIRHWTDTKLLRKANGILTNSLFMQNAIVQRFGIPGDRIHVLPQQIDTIPSGNASPHATIGFVHRGPDKNIALVTQIAQRSPDLTFLIYGHDADLPAHMPANMIFKGWCSDRTAMFASARLWLVPSLWAEPFGRVSIEAQAAERAVLVADHGGLPETVTDSRFKLDGFDPDEWLRRMRLLLTVPEAELIRNSKIIQKRFSARAHDDAIAESLAAIMSTP